MRGYTGGVFICEGVHRGYLCVRGYTGGHLSVREYTGGVFICEGVHRRGIYL